MRKLSEDKLLIATHNKGKLKEFRSLLGTHVKEIVSAGELDLTAPEETGQTFYDNALIKAKTAAEATGIPSLADDSGLCVTALDGGPGVRSARWAEDAGDFPTAMKKIHEAIGSAKDRSAYFICSLVLFWPDGQSFSVEGRCDGSIVWPMRGLGGHGYDPIFLPEGAGQTFAEMESSEKDKESHRGCALRELAKMFELK